jgi:hypothetical protein
MGRKKKQVFREENFLADLGESEEEGQGTPDPG